MAVQNTITERNISTELFSLKDLSEYFYENSGSTIETTTTSTTEEVFSI